MAEFMSAEEQARRRAGEDPPQDPAPPTLPPAASATGGAGPLPPDPNGPLRRQIGGGFDRMSRELGESFRLLGDSMTSGFDRVVSSVQQTRPAAPAATAPAATPVTEPPRPAAPTPAAAPAPAAPAAQPAGERETTRPSQHQTHEEGSMKLRDVLISIAAALAIIWMGGAAIGWVANRGIQHTFSNGYGNGANVADGAGFCGSSGCLNSGNNGNQTGFAGREQADPPHAPRSRWNEVVACLGELGVSRGEVFSREGEDGRPHAFLTPAAAARLGSQGRLGDAKACVGSNA